MKRVLYLCTAPSPALAGTDAVYQEIERLRSHTGGKLLCLYPFKKPSRFVPHWLMGAHLKKELQEAMQNADVLHIYSATLKPLPCINNFEGRIIYTVTASTGAHINTTWFNDRNIIIAATSTRDEEYLNDVGIASAVCITPGMKLDQMTYTAAPPGPFTIMVGSAPWTKAQFRTKGIDALLEAAKRIDNLHIVFLWRNLWHDNLVKRIKRAGLENRVDIHNKRVDVNKVLAGCNAATVLAANERLVKAWPHSAIEALAAGKPVLLSRTIPMSDFAEKNNAGVVVESLRLDEIIDAIRTLVEQQASMSGERLQQLSREQFDPERMIQLYDALYEG